MIDYIVKSSLPKQTEDEINIENNENNSPYENGEEFVDDDDVFISKRSRPTLNRKKAALLSSDEEDGNDENSHDSKSSEENEDDNLLVNGSRKRLLQLQDSDDDEEEPVLSLTMPTDSRSLLQENENRPINSLNYKYNKNIFDTETSDDEPPNNDYNEVEDHPPQKKKFFTKKKKREEKANILKERNAQKMEIFRESQKMIRESEVYLPYHKPKQRTLTEFLNRIKPSPCVEKRRSLKMSMKDEHLLREIEERRKGVDEFYKSESEDEEENEMEQEEVDLGKFEDSEIEKPNSEEMQYQDKMNTQEMPVEDMSDNQKSLLQIVTKKVVPLNDPLKESARDRQTSESKIFSHINNVVQVTLLNNEIQNVSSDENRMLATTAFEKANSTESIGEGINALDPHTISAEKESLQLPSNIKNPLNCFESVKSLDENAVAEIMSSSMDNTESLRLHLDTEDTQEISVMKNNFKAIEFSQELRDIMSGVSVNNDNSSNFNTMPPKFNSLVSRFPQIDLKKISSVIPRIGNDCSGDFIDLNDDFKDTMKGSSSLLDRFVKHSNIKRKPAEAQKVTLNIVSKEKGENGEETLVSSSVEVSLNAEENHAGVDPVPGYRLSLVKSALRAKLLEKREKERQRREKEKQFLDSEEVIQDYEDDLPDEENEMTDKSDTEYETESEPEENDVVITDKKRKRNKYVEDEAEESEDVNEDTESEDEVLSRSASPVANVNDLFSEKSPENIKKKLFEDVNDNAVNLCISYNTDEMPREGKSDIRVLGTHSQTNPPALSRASTEDLFSSQMEDGLSNRASGISATSEFIGSLIPCHQPDGVEGEDNEFPLDEEDNLSLFSKVDHLKRYSPELDNRREKFNLTLTPLKASQFPSSDRDTVKKPIPTCLPINENLTSNDPQELLWLCSGKFTDPSETVSRIDELSKGHNYYPPTQDLVALCSGQFNLKEVKEHNSTELRSERFPLSTLNGETLGLEMSDPAVPNPRMEVLSSDEDGILRRQTKSRKKKKKRKRIIATSDNESEVESLDSLSEDEVECDDDEQPVVAEKFTGFIDSMKGGIRPEFVDKEAELSGSEDESDDLEEPNEEEDIMEQEEGDFENFDEDELRDEVGKAHLKSMMDQDKRQLRLLQEIYFEDGDLHGQGRQRKYRWKNINASKEEARDSDNEGEGSGCSDDEGEWRKERYEREKLIKEQQGAKGKIEILAKEDAIEMNNCVLLKLPLKISKPEELYSSFTSAPEKISSFSMMDQFTSAKRGSFLRRDKSSFNRLAQFNKDTETVGTAKQGGNFVFHTLTEEEVKEKANREALVKKNSQPPTKKCRLERSFSKLDHDSQNRSIFNHF